MLSSGCESPNTHLPVILNPKDTLRADSMRVRWATQIPFNPSEFTESRLRPAIIDDSLIIFGFSEGFVCLNMNTGAIKWQTQIGLTLGQRISVWAALDMIIENGRIYTLASNDAVRGSKASAVCLSVTDGHLNWRHDIAPEESFAWQFSKYSSSPDAIYYSTQSSHVVALSKSDGSVLWDSPNGAYKPLNFQIYQGEPTYKNGILYVCSSFNTPDGFHNDGGVVALDAKTGNVLWKKMFPHADSSSGYYNPALLNENLIHAPPLPTQDGLILTAGFCITLMDDTGRFVWMKAPNINGNLSIYDWQPFLQNGKLYGYNNGNGNYFTFCMDPHTGSMSWIQIALSPPDGATEIFNSPGIDSISTYIISDAFQIFGQSLADGHRDLFVDPRYYSKGDYVPGGEILVRGNRLYYQTRDTQDYIICLERP